MQYLFDSRNKKHRCPTGAIAAGESLRLAVLVPRDLKCSACSLVMQYPDGHEKVSGMFWCGMESDTQEWWDCHFTPDERGVYYYRFVLNTPSGLRALGKTNGSGGIIDSGAFWQLTVYDQTLSTPVWPLGGVMYQIFPDRFYNSQKPKDNVPNDRILRSDWGGQPIFRPDSDGEVRNNDYFGGDLDGITQKLSYLADLGVTTLYLNPIFEAHSNHRYNTADYRRIDPLLGTNQDFERLCSEAKRLGIRVLLDGVFSHTGSDSIYFNKENRYDGPGASQSTDSPYFHWYSFSSWPNQFNCWWGFQTLPEVNETCLDFIDFICGANGVLAQWQALGASGIRLDVADELPDAFLDALHASLRERDPNAFLIGEVWEDASNKYSYCERRRYLLGGQLDSVMNYPFADAILGFVSGGYAEQSNETVETILEHYPKCTVDLLMNHIGTHDTVRAITRLAGEALNGRDREWQATHSLTPEQADLGRQRMRLASAIQFTLPGIPCIYYGDEIGMEGYKDPFNRACFDWERQTTLSDWYRALGALRREQDVYAQGGYRCIYAQGDLWVFARIQDERQLVTAVNRGDWPAQIELPHAHVVLGDGRLENNRLHMPPVSVTLLEISKEGCVNV